MNDNLNHEEVGNISHITIYSICLGDLNEEELEKLPGELKTMVDDIVNSIRPVWSLENNEVTDFQDEDDYEFPKFVNSKGAHTKSGTLVMANLDLSSEAVEFKNSIAKRIYQRFQKNIVKRDPEDKEFWWIDRFYEGEQNTKKKNALRETGDPNFDTDILHTSLSYDQDLDATLEQSCEKMGISKSEELRFQIKGVAVSDTDLSGRLNPDNAYLKAFNVDPTNDISTALPYDVTKI
jgi:hypothetical protein